VLLPQYTGIVVWDFEFRPDADHRQSAVCATFLELRSGRRVALWGEFGAQPPFPTAPDWLWVSYHASAETGCHPTLGWLIPETILDLEAEFPLRDHELPGGGRQEPAWRHARVRLVVVGRD
jgi:hypothetical protein